MARPSTRRMLFLLDAVEAIEATEADATGTAKPLRWTRSGTRWETRHEHTARHPPAMYDDLRRRRQRLPLTGRAATTLTRLAWSAAQYCERPGACRVTPRCDGRGCHTVASETIRWPTGEVEHYCTRAAQAEQARRRRPADTGRRGQGGWTVNIEEGPGYDRERSAPDVAAASMCARRPPMRWRTAAATRWTTRLRESLTGGRHGKPRRCRSSPPSA